MLPRRAATQGCVTQQTRLPDILHNTPMNKISELPYYQTRELRGTIAGHALRVVTKPGFAGWEAIGAPTELLAEAVVSPPDARVAIFGCGHGALGAVLSRIVPRGRIVLLDPSAIALAMAEQTLVANGARNASVLDSISLLPEQANSFDLVLIDLPQSRQLARRWLAEAHTLLQVGGQLLLAGPNDQGIQSVIDDAAALFGNAGLVADAEDEHGFARHLTAVLSSEVETHRLRQLGFARAAQFSWRDTAQRILHCYEQVGQMKSASTTPLPFRSAV